MHYSIRTRRQLYSYSNYKEFTGISCHIRVVCTLFTSAKTPLEIQEVFAMPETSLDN